MLAQIPSNTVGATLAAWPQSYRRLQLASILPRQAAVLDGLEPAMVTYALREGVLPR